MGLSSAFLWKDDRRTYKQNNPNEIVAIDGMSYMLTLEYTPTNASSTNRNAIVLSPMPEGTRQKRPRMTGGSIFSFLDRHCCQAHGYDRCDGHGHSDLPLARGYFGERRPRG